MSSSNNNTLSAIIQQFNEKVDKHEKKRFNFLTDVNEKIHFVERLLTKYQLLKNIRQRTEKNKEIFTRYAARCNEALNNPMLKPYILRSINKCIAFAENDKEYLINTYMMRSEIFYVTKMYIECLSDINLILKSKHCSSENKAKYETRKKICENAIEEFKTTSSEELKEDVNRMTKLTYPKHSKIPFIANCLKLEKKLDFGRSIQTTCDLKIGDIIAIEKPFVSTLNKSFVYEHCTNCLKETFSLIPCPSCTLAMFCNRKCLEIAYEKFHKYECTVIDYIFETFTDFRLTSVRMALQTILLFKNIDRLKGFLNNQEGIDTNIFNIDNINEINDNDDSDTNDSENEDHYGNYTLNMSEQNYHPVQGLANGITKKMKTFHTDQHLKLAILIILAKQLLTEILPADVLLISDKSFINSFLYRQFQISRIYTKAPSKFTAEIVNNLRQDQLLSFGEALYPFSGLINHSCAPNVMYIYNGSTVNIVVIRPIKQNEQLLVNYSNTFATDLRTERQLYLKNRYDFKCRCEACLHNYPIEIFLPNDSELPSQTMAPDIQTDLQRIINNIKRSLEFLSRYSNEKYYPCKQLSTVERKLVCYFSYFVRNSCYHLLKKS